MILAERNLRAQTNQPAASAHYDQQWQSLIQRQKRHHMTFDTKMMF